jgi:magnesium-transporting ATPase (P-type)
MPAGRRRHPGAGPSRRGELRVIIGLHAAWLRATTMPFAGIVACQVGTAFASRAERACSRAIAWTSNPLLLWAIAFEIAFASALIYLPPLQVVFGEGARRARGR